MAYREALVFPKTQKQAKKFKKNSSRKKEIGEIASEDERKVMDHKQTVKLI
jgi:hypothetical protein